MAVFGLFEPDPTRFAGIRDALLKRAWGSRDMDAYRAAKGAFVRAVLREAVVDR